MNRKSLLSLCGASVLLLATAGGALASKTGPTVTIRIEGAKKTLLLPTQVTGRKHSITRGGAAPGKCPGESAQGALDVATHGHWNGKWYAAYNEYFISSILGEKPKGNSYWTIFVNNRSSSVGACDIKLKRGQQLLFAVTNGSQGAASLKAPHSAIAGHTFDVKLVGYAAKKAPLGGVWITGHGVKSSKTNAHGVALITDDHAGVLVLHAAPKRYVRTEAIIHVAS